MQRHLQKYRIRKLWPLETETFRRHLLRLDPETRQFRFGTPVNDNFLNALGYRLDEVAGKHHSMFVDPTYARSAEYKKFWADLNAGTVQQAEYKRVG